MIGFILGLLVFVGIIMMFVAFRLKVEDNDTNKGDLFILGMTITLFCMFALGGAWFYKQEHKVKYQIKPSIEIMIKDGKADTTYIYKFKEEK
jgi:Na+-driven multidrug efflux pump